MVLLYPDKMKNDIHNIIDKYQHNHSGWHGVSCSDCNEMVQELAEYTQMKIRYYLKWLQELE